MFEINQSKKGKGDVVKGGKKKNNKNKRKLELVEESNEPVAAKNKKTRYKPEKEVDLSRHFSFIDEKPLLVTDLI